MTAYGIARNTVPTSTTTQDFTDNNFGGGTPNAAVVILTAAVDSGSPLTPTNGLAGCIGFVTGASNECSRSWCSEDGQSTTDTSTYEDPALTIALIENGDHSATTIEAEFDSFITNGLRLNFTKVSGDEYFVQVWLFEADDALALPVTMGSQGVPVDVTAPGFEPDVIIATGQRVSGGSPGNDACMGFAVNDGSNTQISFAWKDDNAVATTNVRSNFNTARLIIAAQTTGAVLVSNYDSSGCSLTPVDSTLFESHVIHCLFLKLNGPGFNLRQSTLPTDTGQNGRSSTGFIPGFVAILFTDRVDSGIEIADETGGAYGISAFTQTAEFCSAWATEDGVGTSNTQSLSDSIAINFDAHDGSQRHLANFVSVGDGSAYTLDDTVVDTSARFIIELMLEEEPAPTTEDVRRFTMHRRQLEEQY